MAATATKPVLLTLEEAVALLALSPRTMRRKAASGEIRAVKLGAGPTCRIRIPADAVDEYLRKHTIRAPRVVEDDVSGSAPSRR